jgi:hypothetical protein
MPHFISQYAAIHVLVSVLEAEACHLEAFLRHVGLEAYHHEIQSLYMYLAFQEILLVFEYRNQTYVLPSNIHHTNGFLLHLTFMYLNLLPSLFEKNGDGSVARVQFGYYLVGQDISHPTKCPKSRSTRVIAIPRQNAMCHCARSGSLSPPLLVIVDLARKNGVSKLGD